MYLPTLAGPKALGSVTVAAQLMYLCRVNLTHPSWVRHTAHLHTDTVTYGQWSWCSSLSAYVIQHSCEMAICSGYPDIQHLDKSIQSLLKAAEREISCCKQQTSIHAGRAGKSAKHAWIQCSWDPNTAVCELYQEDTTIELLPKFSTCIA